MDNRNKYLKNFAVFGIVFIISFLLGAFSIYSFWTSTQKKELAAYTHWEIVNSHLLLSLLRDNQDEKAIIILEGQLDSALSRLSYLLRHNFVKKDEIAQSMLNKIREYREQHPGEYSKSPLVQFQQQEIDALLNQRELPEYPENYKELIEQEKELIKQQVENFENKQK